MFDLRRVPVTASTNDDAVKAAEAGEAEGLVIWALRQTAGKGRHGRAWESPEGNLYCSVLLRPKEGTKQAGLYSFVAALALYDTVRLCLPVSEISLKWPNDVLVEGEKIAGILIEAGADWLVIGVGLNVLHHPDSGLYPSTSLLAVGAHDKKLDDILDWLLQNLSHWYGIMREEGFAPIRTAWLKHAVKGRLSVRLPQETITGEFAGLDERGNLRLKLADGSERAIASGDAFPAAQGQ